MTPDSGQIRMKLCHISITARGAQRLARFYQDALGLHVRRPAKRLSDPLISRGTGVPDAVICSIWLDFPDGAKPFLEILEYQDAAKAEERPINAPGLGHIALQVLDLEATLERVLQCGGRQQGEIVDLGSPERPCLCVYLRDPEGNLLELEG